MSRVALGAKKRTGVDFLTVKTTIAILRLYDDPESRVGKGRPAGSIRASGFPFPL